MSKFHFIDMDDKVDGWRKICQGEKYLKGEQLTKCGHNFDTNRSTKTHNVTNHEGTLYCGMTKRKFAARMAEHRDYAKFHKTEEPSGQHFSLPGHSFHHLQGLAIEKVINKDPFILKAREAWLIKSLTAIEMV